EAELPEQETGVEIVVERERHLSQIVEIAIPECERHVAMGRHPDIAEAIDHVRALKGCRHVALLLQARRRLCRSAASPAPLQALDRAPERAGSREQPAFEGE